MKKITYLMVGLLTVLTSRTILAQTTISSIMSSDETWTPAGNPYMLTANALVKEGVKLTIKPGVIIKATGYFKILIDGTIIADGKKDSIIQIETATFNLTTSAVGYNFNTGNGSKFNYCYFNGSGTGGLYTINLNSISLLVSNCKFYNCYYCIYGSNSYYDTCTVRVEKTEFYGGPIEAGYAVYLYGQYTFLEMDECLVKDMYGMSIPNYAIITHSTFYNWKTYSGLRINVNNVSYFGKVVIACNTFRKFRNSIIDLYGIPSKTQVVINNNTFDSADNLLNISLYYITPPNKTGLYIHSNNFLYASNYAIKTQYSQKAGVYDTLDLTGNYWGSRSGSQIDGAIYDFNDDITVGGLVDHSSELSSEVTDCQIQNPAYIPLDPAGTFEIGLKNFEMSPNPARSFVNLSTGINGKYTVHILNISGQNVLSTQFNGTSGHIETASLTSGIYIVQIESDNVQFESKKLIINK